MAAVGLMLLLSVAATAVEPPEEIVHVATEANKDPVQVHEALTVQGLGEDQAREYLMAVGDLERPRPVLNPSTERLLDCLAWHESRNVPSARNRSSGAAGLYQFLPSTFRTTPQGRAGLSPYDPIAAREAARWMLGQGRLKEWAVWRRCA